MTFQINVFHFNCVVQTNLYCLDIFSLFDLIISVDVGFPQLSHLIVTSCAMFCDVVEQENITLSTISISESITKKITVRHPLIKYH